MGLSPYRLAKDISVRARRINEIVHGKRAISADAAFVLARYSGTTARSWLAGGRGAGHGPARQLLDPGRRPPQARRPAQRRLGGYGAAGGGAAPHHLHVQQALFRHHHGVDRAAVGQDRQIAGQPLVHQVAGAVVAAALLVTFRNRRALAASRTHLRCQPVRPSARRRIIGITMR